MIYVKSYPCELRLSIRSISSQYALLISTWHSPILLIPYHTLSILSVSHPIFLSYHHIITVNSIPIPYISSYHTIPSLGGTIHISILLIRSLVLPIQTSITYTLLLLSIPIHSNQSTIDTYPVSRVNYIPQTYHSYLFHTLFLYFLVLSISVLSIPNLSSLP